MQRYSGKLGVIAETETSSGVWEDVVTEKDILGTIKTMTEAVETADSVQPVYRTTTTVSVVDRGVGVMDHSSLRYLTVGGTRRVIQSVTPNYPMLDLYVGEEYHGPTPV